jgi:hypothetical protein
MSRAKKNWIESAVKKPSALRRSLKIKAGHTIPKNKLDKLLNSKNKLTAKRANLAKTLKSFH